MTKKQALNYLRSSGFSKEQIQAVVDALQEPTTKNDLGVDCISRQEAIDTIRQLYLDLASQKAVIDILKVLPTVTPISKECIDCIAEDKTFDKMDRVKQLLNNDKLDDWEVLKKIGEVVEE